MASHNHFLISERGQRKETMTEGQYESRDKWEREREEGELRGYGKKNGRRKREGERAGRKMESNKRRH